MQNWLQKQNQIDIDFLGLKLQELQKAVEVKPITFTEPLNLNVGGTSQVVGRGTLTSVFGSYMSHFFSQIGIDEQGRYTGEEIFIDRDPEVFT